MNRTAPTVYVDTTPGAGAVPGAVATGGPYSFRAGRVTAVLGSGAAALLRGVAGLRRVAPGSIRIDGTDLGLLDDAALLDLRRRGIGVLGRSPMLVPGLTVRENVELPMRLAGAVPAGAGRTDVLERTGLAARRDDLAAGLDRATAHRVAVARALSLGPAVVVADHPAEELDHGLRRELLGMVATAGSTVLVAGDATDTAFADEAVLLGDHPTTVAVA